MVLARRLLLMDLDKNTIGFGLSVLDRGELSDIVYAKKFNRHISLNQYRTVVSICSYYKKQRRNYTTIEK